MIDLCAGVVPEPEGQVAEEGEDDRFRIAHLQRLPSSRSIIE